MNKSSHKLPQDTPLTRDNYARGTAELYDGIAEWYVSSFWNDETDSDWIKLCLSSVDGKRSVADIGSGPGNYARFFVEAGHNVTCMDISVEMIREAKLRLPSIDAVVSDMRHMPFDTSCFDCVFCAYSINHVIKADFQTTLQEFLRILRPSGLLCLMLKTGSHSYEFSNGRRDASRGIMCLYSSAEVLSTLQSLGVHLTVTEYKKETSSREFQHEKMLIIGTKAQ